MDSNPENQQGQKNIVREQSAPWPAIDPLAEFIRQDLADHPDHRAAYEAVATAFGYRKERR